MAVSLQEVRRGVDAMKVHIWDNGAHYSDHSVYFVRQGDLTDDEIARFFRAWSAYQSADEEPEVLGVVDEAELAPETAVELHDLFDCVIHDVAGPRGQGDRIDAAIDILGPELTLRLLAKVEGETEKDRLRKRREKLEVQWARCPEGWDDTRAALEAELRNARAAEEAWRSKHGT